METAHLFHLAKISTLKGKISAAATHMVFAGRTGDGHSFIDPEVVETLEPAVGRACLDAIIAFEIKEDVSRSRLVGKGQADEMMQRIHPERGSVWEKK
jgi:uridine phosphorylase